METFSRETLPPSPIPPLNPWYVTGLIEGGGCFTFSRSGRNLALYFALKLSKADRPLLEASQRFFGVGKIYDVIPQPPTRGAVYYRVTRNNDLPRVIEHLETYPLHGRKAEAYEIWREMVNLRQAHFRRQPREAVAQLAEALSRANQS